MVNLNKLAQQIHDGNKSRGFDSSKDNIGQLLMLVVSELSEALEADRKCRRSMVDAFERDLEYARTSITDLTPENENCQWVKNRFDCYIKDTFEDEIADSLMRILDLCCGLGIDIEKHVDLKMRYNSTRPFKHGKKY